MMDPGAVRVSVVIPLLDEIAHIASCLDGFASQDFDLSRLEVLVVDGGSSDGSREYVEQRARSERWLRLLDNPRRKAAAAFNVGARAATGDMICIFSAHGVPTPTYVRASVEALCKSGADGVGGRYLHVGLDKRSSAVGLAMASPFGMASPHRIADRAKDVDTISHPAYVATSLRDVLPFDERLDRNSDYELNWRARRAGMVLRFDPYVASVYRPRPDLGALGRQFWWYGRWKWRVIREHPASLRVRHLAAPTAVAVAGSTPIAVRTRTGRRMLAGLAGAYAAGALAATVMARPWERDASARTLVACFPVMHLCWGAGFLRSLAEDLTARSKGSS